MLDGYLLADPPFTSVKEFRELERVNAPAERDWVPVFQDRNGANIAAMVNIQDHEFLEAVRKLVSKVNDHDTELGMTVAQFVKQAMEKEFEPVALSNDVSDNYYYPRQLVSRSKITRNHIDGAANEDFHTLVTSNRIDSAQLVSYEDHAFLESIRAVFQEAERGEDIREQLAKMLLNEFVAVTEKTEIDQDIYKTLTGTTAAHLSRSDSHGRNVVDLSQFGYGS